MPLMRIATIANQRPHPLPEKSAPGGAFQNIVRAREKFARLGIDPFEALDQG